MGGTDEKENLIELTIEQHAEEHWVLYCMYGNQEDYLAWVSLSGQIGKEEIIKERCRLGAINRWSTPEGRKEKSESVSGSKNPMFGKSHSDSAKQKMRQKKLGHKFNVGVPLSEERKQNISKALKALEYDRYPCGKKTAATFWWNDGTNHKRSSKCPGNGWVKGRINKGNLGGNRI